MKQWLRYSGFLISALTMFVIFSCEDVFLEDLEEKVVTATTIPAPPLMTGISITSNTRPTWTWTVPEGVTNIRYQLDGEDSDNWTTVNGSHISSYTPDLALSEGSHTLYVQFKGSVDGWSESASFTILIDLTALDAPVVSGTAVTNNQKPEWSWNIPEGAVDIRYQLDSQSETGWIFADGIEKTSFIPDNDIPEGSHILYVQAKNDLGNWSGSGYFSVSIDITPPVISNLSDDSEIKREKTWNWNSDDVDAEYRYIIDSSSLEPVDWADVTWTTDKTASLSTGNGTFYIHVQAKDELGNLSEIVTVSTILDSNATAAPNVSAQNPTNDTTPTWTWDIPTGATNIRYQLDSESETWQVTGGTSVLNYTPLSPISEGKHILYVQAGDSVGNWSASGSKEIQIDLTAPIVNAGDDILWSNTAVTINGSVSDATSTTTIWEKTAGTGTIIFGNDSVLSTTIIGPSGTEAEYTIRLTATDAVDYSNSDTLSFFWDDKAPVPGNNGTLAVTAVDTNSLTLSWTEASDLSTGAAALHYKVVRSDSDNIRTVADVEETGGGRFTVQDWTSGITSRDITGLIIGGTYYFAVLVKDQLDNISIYAESSFYLPEAGSSVVIDPDLPGEITINLSGTESTMSRGIDFTVTATSLESFDSWQWYLNGNLQAGETDSSITIGSELGIGYYILTCRAKIGNRIYSESVAFNMN